MADTLRVDVPIGWLRRVELTFEDGTVMSAEGDDADRWHEQVASWAVLAMVHGLTPQKVTWTTRRPSPPESEGGDRG
jgi:hypothetical protein